MIYKLLIFSAGLALAASTKRPNSLVTTSPLAAYENEDTLYIPTSNPDTELLRLPSEAVTLSIGRRKHEPLMYNDGALLLVEPLNHNDRAHLGVLPVLEKKCTYYSPLSDDEAGKFELQDLLKLEGLSRIGEHLESNSDAEIHDNILTAVMSSSANNRQKRQLFRRNNEGFRLSRPFGLNRRRSGASGSIVATQPMFRSQFKNEQGFRGPPSFST